MWTVIGSEVIEFFYPFHLFQRFESLNRTVHSIDRFGSDPISIKSVLATSEDLFQELEQQYVPNRGGSYSQRQT